MSGEHREFSYRGHRVQLDREECMGGWEMLYFYIERESDLYCCEASFTEGEDDIDDFAGYMRERIDAELASDDPWGEHAEDSPQ